MRHLLLGGDPDAERVYRWHIEKRSGERMAAGLPTDRWKRSIDDYLHSAKRLLASILARGFHSAGSIPIDPEGGLLGGAHRMACALALGIAEVPVTRVQRRVWAPAWGEDWFIENGMAAEDLARVRADMACLMAGA
jgi:hypothetical protein